MASPTPPCRWCTCGSPVTTMPFPSKASLFAPNRPRWMSQLAEANFSEACVTDRVCTTCGGAAFCEHCCGEHHRGHDTSPAPAENGHAPAAHRRDSFCTACRVAFCSDLCAHHKNAAGGGGQAHDVIPIVVHDSWYCARCTGGEDWFIPIFDGVQTFQDEHRNLLVPLHWRWGPLPECPSWFSRLVSVDFSETCATDRVCNTCGGAGFCEHCCGKHHRDHDTSAATAKDDKEPSAVHRRDSFCTACRVAFCSDLCAHHAACHEVIPIDEHDGWYCARCTGNEPWFPGVVYGGQTFEDEHGNKLKPLHEKSMAILARELTLKYAAMVQHGEECPSWLSQLLAVNFSKTCARDRVCNTCDAVFCEHCCGEHHRGHDTAAATAKEMNGSAVSEGHRRDAFCIGCGVGFCSELCAHHAGHEVVPIGAYGDRHFVRSTGSESWFTPSAFDGIETFKDEHGNKLKPLHRQSMAILARELTLKHGAMVQHGEECPSWLSRLLAVNFSKTCARDRVCNTCDAVFCEHCCGEHHRGHDTAAATAEEMNGSAVPEGHRRNSFCIGCGVGFCSELCAHHAGHEVVPIDAYGDRHFVRSTGSESWFTPSAFDGIETFEDKDGNLMVPLERKRSMFPEPGLSYRYATTPPIVANELCEMDGASDGGELR